MITAKDTDRMRTTTSFPVPGLLTCLLLSLLLLGGCSSRGYINLKIHSEPEGSFLVYKIDKLRADRPSPWIYLGQTPFAGVSLIEVQQNSDITYRLFDYGRPASIKLAVLADRGGRELPIYAEFCPWQADLDDSEKLTLEPDASGRLQWKGAEHA